MSGCDASTRYDFRRRCRGFGLRSVTRRASVSIATSVRRRASSWPLVQLDTPTFPISFPAKSLGARRAPMAFDAPPGLQGTLLDF